MASTSTQRLTYPPVRRDESCRDNPKNTPDPYRWLEDPDSPETRAFVEAQNKLTFDYLQSQCSTRVKAKARMEELYNYAKYSCPFKRGERYYYFHNTGLQNQSVLFVQDSLTAEPRVFLDPNTLSKDGTTALSVYEWSESGRYFAYGVSHAGSDWVEIHVMDTHTGKLLSEVLKWVKFSGISWMHDERGFFYCRYPTPASHAHLSKPGHHAESAVGAAAVHKAGTETDKNEHQKVYYHVLGEPQEKDSLVFDVPEQPAWMYGAEVTDDGKYVVIEVSESTAPVNRVFIAELSHWTSHTNRLPVKRLIDDFKAQFSYLANDGTVFYFRSNLNAPRNKVIAIDIADPAESNWRTIIVEHDTDVLNTVAPVHKHYLLTTRTHDVKDVLELRRLTDGSLVRSFTDSSLVGSIYPTCRRRDDEFFFKYVSFLAPGTIYRYAFSDEKLSAFRQIEVKGFDASRFHTEQVFYNSKDGTRIPMFLVHATSMQRTGDNPVLLYGYGGFNISLQPSFSTFQLVWIQHYGGVLAIPNIRGGGEYGEEWHKSGILDKKQNGFDDFMAAAEFLISEKITRSERICIQGGSNGGLLVGACITQRPQLFGAGIAQVGVLDMLRFHKFTIGHAWCADYGNPDEPHAAEVLLKYSPLHNVRAEKPFPALLLTTGDHDDRVSPLHSYKFIAEVQHILGSQPSQTKPLLIRIETKAGHGAGIPTAKLLEEAADRYAFAATATGAKWIDV